MSNDVREWQITAPHEYVGNIYGYPKCCIDAYSEHMRTGIFQKNQSAKTKSQKNYTAYLILRAA